MASSQAPGISPTSTPEPAHDPESTVPRLNDEHHQEENDNNDNNQNDPEIPPIRPGTDQDQEQKPDDAAVVPLSKIATHLYAVSYLVFFSIWGTLARLGLQALTFYTGAPVVTSVLWANVGGSLLMGFFLEDQNIFKEEWGNTNNDNSNDNNNNPQENPQKAHNHKTTKKTLPLYIGLTVGFCGSFTSFSSFLRDVFLTLSNDLPDPSRNSLHHATPLHRNGGYSFMAVIATILIEVSLSLSALVFGAHFACALARLRVVPTVPFRVARNLVDPIFVLLGWGCWVGAVFMVIWPPDRDWGGGRGGGGGRGSLSETETWRGQAVFAIVFAPAGCLFRFYVSMYLNSRVPRFPLGTFVANIVGTMVLGMCYDLQHVRGLGARGISITHSHSNFSHGFGSGSSKVGVGVGVGSTPYSLKTGCQVLQGVMDGFCGAATTVSTWVAEMQGLGSRWSAYVYGVVSVGVGLGVLVIIMGSLRWTRGFDEVVC